MPVSNNTQQGRIPPQAVEVERDVLGSMLTDHEAIPAALHMLTEADFYEPRNQKVYRAIQTLYDAGDPITFLAIEEKLKKMKALDEIGGPGYLVDLTASTTSSANVEYHCQIIIEKSKARQAILNFSKLMEQAYDPAADVYDVLTAAENFVYQQITGESTQQTQTIDRVLVESLKYLESIQGSSYGIIGLASGLDIDSILSGFQPGKLYVAAGRPGTGKTAIILQILKRIAAAGHSAGIISLEMGARSLGNRMVLAHAGIDNTKALQGKLNNDELKRLSIAAGQLSEMNLIIDDTTHLTPALLRIKARMMKQIHKIDVLAVDYLQLMASEGKQSREQEVADISRTCKLLSKELDIPIIALAQLSREPDKRRGWATRPQLSDLRESGAIEQDADVVMFLYRPEEYGIERYESGASTSGVTEIIIAKHRDGPTGFKKLLFEKSTMTFKNHVPDRQPDPRPAPEPIQPHQLPYKDDDYSPF